jgi:hypothetical protein
VSIVERRAPYLLPVATDAVNKHWLSEEECEDLSRVVLAELLHHLGPDDQPDRNGAEADDLLGVIEMQRRSYWRP